jgi:hypothetical protein
VYIIKGIVFTETRETMSVINNDDINGMALGVTGVYKAAKKSTDVVMYTTKKKDGTGFENRMRKGLNGNRYHNAEFMKVAQVAREPRVETIDKKKQNADRQNARDRKEARLVAVENRSRPVMYVKQTKSFRKDASGIPTDTYPKQEVSSFKLEDIEDGPGNNDKKRNALCKYLKDLKKKMLIFAKDQDPIDFGIFSLNINSIYDALAQLPDTDKPGVWFGNVESAVKNLQKQIRGACSKVDFACASGPQDMAVTGVFPDFGAGDGEEGDAYQAFVPTPQVKGQQKDFFVPPNRTTDSIAQKAYVGAYLAHFLNDVSGYGEKQKRRAREEKPKRLLQLVCQAKPAAGTAGGGLAAEFYARCTSAA